MHRFKDTRNVAASCSDDPETITVTCVIRICNTCSSDKWHRSGESRGFRGTLKQEMKVNKTKISERRKLVGVLNGLVNEGEIVVDDSKTGELLSGEDIRIILMKGDVIHICLSENIIVRREKKIKEGLNYRLAKIK